MSRAAGYLRQHLPETARARRFVLATAVDNLGTGIHFVIFPIYLITTVGISPTLVGAGLSFAAVLGLIAAVPIGQTVDRLNPQAVLFVGTALQAAVAVTLVFTRTFALFCLAICIGRVASQGVKLARMVMIARVGGDERNRLRGQMTVAMNVGYASGMGVSGLLLAVGSEDAFTVGFIINAVTYLVAGLLQGTIDGAGARAAADNAGSRPNRWAALQDRSYVSVACLSALVYFHQSVLVLGIPLWIAASGAVPLWTATVVFGVNMAMTVLLQMRASNRVTNVGAAAKAMRFSSTTIAAGCGLVAVATAGVPAPLAIAVVITSAILLTLGEMWSGAAEYELSVALAPEASLGTYQAVFAMGIDAADVAGPLAVALLCVTLGATGWLLVAGLFVALAILAMPLVTWAQRSGHRQPVTSGAF